MIINNNLANSGDLVARRLISLFWVSLWPDALSNFSKSNGLVFSTRANASHLAGTMHGHSSLNALSHPDSSFEKLGVSKAYFIRMRGLQGRAVKRFAI